MLTRRGWSGWLRSVLGGAGGTPPSVDESRAQQVILVGDESRLAAAWRGATGVAGGHQPGGVGVRARVLVIPGESGAYVYMKHYGDNAAGSFPFFWRVMPANAAIAPASGIVHTIYNTVPGRPCRTRVLSDLLTDASFNGQWATDPINFLPDVPTMFENSIHDEILPFPLFVGPGFMLETATESDTIFDFTVWIEEPGSAEA